VWATLTIVGDDGLTVPLRGATHRGRTLGILAGAALLASAVAVGTRRRRRGPSTG
jgi:hypothetical protein